MAYAYSINS
jgi:hypothetical protein